MTAFVLFLCIVLSELVSFSLSWSTQIYCPDRMCMIIDGNVCCGENASGPKSASNYVLVNTPAKAQEASALIEAGFPSDDYFDEESIPTCSQIYKWPARALILKVTDNLALEYFPFGPTIPQKYKASSIIEGDDWWDTCPWYMGGYEVQNPYYDYDRIKKPEQAKVSKVSLSGLSNSEPNVEINNLISKPDVADNSVNSYNPISPPVSSSGDSIATPLSPVGVASTLETNPNTAGLIGGDCTESNCDVALSEQQNPSIFRRGTPIEFQA